MDEKKKEIFSRSEDGLEVKAFVTEDRLKLFIDVSRTEERKSVSVAQLKDLLSPTVPEDKIDDRVLVSIVAKLKSELVVEGRRIVKGRPAEVGMEGKLLLMAKAFGGKGEVLIDERGYANYAELQLFDNIEKDQIIARLYPPKDGIDGEDVLGEVIPAIKGEEYGVELDDSLKLEPLGEGDRFQVIRSQTEGYLAQEGKSLCIKEELVLKGDLDVRTGNLRFIGKIIIQGDVKPGIEIRAEKGIEIKGDVTKAKLTAPGSSIIVKGIIHGGNETRIVCGENFKAKAVISSFLEVGGSIEVDQEIRDSDVHCLRNISLPKGQIIGGSIFTVCGVEARRIGNGAQVPTRIVLCSDLEATSEFSEIVLKLASHERVRDLLKLHLGIYAQRPERIESLHQPYRKKMQDFLRKLQAVELSLEKLKLDKEEYLLSAQTSEIARVNVRDTLFAGVTVIAGTTVFNSREDIIGPKTIAYSYENQTFEVKELEEIQCQFDTISKGECNEQRSTDTGS